MSLVEAYITWDLTFWLCEVVDLEYSEKLGIWDYDQPFDPVYEYIQENSEVPEWAEARENIRDSYVNKRNYGSDLYETVLRGPCEVCRLSSCKPREASEKLWEL